MAMVREYIFLASGCVSVGVVVTYAVLGICQRLGISIEENLWVLAIPAASALLLNVSILELYRRWRRRG